MRHSIRPKYPSTDIHHVSLPCHQVAVMVLEASGLVSLCTTVCHQRATDQALELLALLGCTVVGASTSVCTVSSMDTFVRKRSRRRPRGQHPADIHRSLPAAPFPPHSSPSPHKPSSSLLSCWKKNQYSQSITIIPEFPINYCTQSSSCGAE